MSAPTPKTVHVTGANAVTDPKLSSGVCYASVANKLTGPLVEQASIFPDLANPSFQEHANEAIHRFIS